MTTLGEAVQLNTLRGKRILIVGGGSGIGAHVAVAAASHSAAVTVVGRTAEKIDRVAQQLECDAHQMDASDEAAVSDFALTQGAFDHVVGCTSDHASGPITGLSSEAFQRAVAGKLTCAFLLMKHLAPRMPEDGSFTFLSGVRGWKMAPGGAVTAMVNRGLAALALAGAVDLAPIRVNVVSPGSTDTGEWSSKDRATLRDSFANYANSAPAGRVATGDDVAQVIMSTLVNGYITGSLLHVDGGARLV